MSLNFRLKSALSTCVALCASPAFAQEVAQPQPGQQASSGMTDIVVTARRKEERLQDVPIAVSVLNAQTLKDNQVYNIEDISRSTSNVLITPSSFGASSPSLTIRGQHQQENLIYADPSIGIYFAEFLLQRPQGTNSAFYDLDSVQVLKGPQGTLFGKNTTGGALLITPQKPTFDDAHGRFTGGVGNYGLRTTDVAVNVPLSDKLAVRIAGHTTKHDGYVKNLAPGQPDRNNEDSQSIRTSVRFKSGDLDSNTIYQYVHYRDNGTGFRLVGLNPAAGVFTRFPNLLAAAQAQFEALKKSDDFSVFNDTPDPNKVSAHTLTNTTTLDLGGVTLKNVVGYRKVQFQGTGDFDGLALSLPPQAAGSNLPLYGTFNISATNQWSEEFQVSGDLFDNRFSWITGVYVFREHSDEAFRTVNGSASITYTQSGGTNKSQSAFAQGTFKITDNLSATGGVRWTWDQRSISTFATIQALTSATPACRIRAAGNVIPSDCSVSLDYKNNAPTWTASLDYKIDGNNMIYIAHRRGYRSGGVNNRAYTPADTQSFKPERVDDIEIGLKTTNRLGGVPIRFNADVFYQKYSNIQRLLSPISGGLVLTSVYNAAKASIKGFEADVTILPVEGLSLSAYYGYTDTSYKSFNDPFSGLPLKNDTGGLVVDQHFAFVAKHSAGGTAAFTQGIDRVGTFSANANVAYTGSYLVSESSLLGRVKAATLVNASVGLAEIADTKLDARIFVKNVFDKGYMTGGISLYGVGFLAQNPGTPRTYGLELSYSF